MVAPFLLLDVVPLSPALVLLQIVSVLFVVVLLVCVFPFGCSLIVFFWVLFVAPAPRSFFLVLFFCFARCGTSSRLAECLGLLCSVEVGFFSAGAVVVICI